MEKGKKVDLFRVEEWTIENFSCWNREIHDQVITTSKSYNNPDITIDLFPRGLGGHGFHLVVRLYCSEPIVFFGDVSFIASDGSLICTQQVDSVEELDVLELPPGPKFKDVVSKIRKNETLHKDKLKLRIRLRRHKDTIVYRRTTIDVFDASFKICPSFLDDFNSKFKRLFVIQYPLDQEIQEMVLDVSEDKTDLSKMAFMLQPVHHVRDILVFTQMSLLNDEDILRTEKNRHIFRGLFKWTFSNSLTKDEIRNNKFSFVLYLKIIPSNQYRRFFGVFQIYPQTTSLIPRKKITLSGTGVSEEKFSEIPTPVPLNKPNDSVTVLTEELMCLYQDQAFSDFELKCGDVSIPVHKNILSARSPVFKTMLSTDMQEAVSGCMDIVDLDPSTLGLFLTYLYTGAVEELHGESALKLYYAADKYQVPSLKKECAYFFSANVSISNVCDILSLANKHQDDQLIAVVHEFILNNYNEVLSSDEWKSFLRSEPLLVAQTVTHFAEKKYVKKSDVHEN